MVDGGRTPLARVERSPVEVELPVGLAEDANLSPTCPAVELEPTTSALEVVLLDWLRLLATEQLPAELARRVKNILVAAETVAMPAGDPLSAQYILRAPSEEDCPFAAPLSPCCRFRDVSEHEEDPTESPTSGQSTPRVELSELSPTTSAAIGSASHNDPSALEAPED